MVAVGGLLVFAYVRSGFEIRPIVAINIGASAPLTIATFVANAPKLDAGEVKE
jgi:hypothetical protein